MLFSFSSINSLFLCTIHVPPQLLPRSASGPRVPRCTLPMTSSASSPVLSPHPQPRARHIPAEPEFATAHTTVPVKSEPHVQGGIQKEAVSVMRVMRCVQWMRLKRLWMRTAAATVRTLTPLTGVNHTIPHHITSHHITSRIKQLGAGL